MRTVRGRMARVSHNSTKRVAEDRRRLLERYSVFCEIPRSLSRIPLELPGQVSSYRRIEGGAPGTGRPRLSLAQPAGRIDSLNQVRQAAIATGDRVREPAFGLPGSSAAAAHPSPRANVLPEKPRTRRFPPPLPNRPRTCNLIDMPELPDIAAYITALEPRVLGLPLERVRLASPFLLRTTTPALSEVEGKVVRELRRVGKRIAIGLEGELWLVLHLMIAGRLHWKPAHAALKGRQNLAAFDFPPGSLTLTEAGSRRRASLHVVAGEAGLLAMDPGGIDVLSADLEAFRAALTRENRTLKRALTYPRIASGVGNAYSDEILHAARLSPLALTRKLTDDEWDRPGHLRNGPIFVHPRLVQLHYVKSEPKASMASSSASDRFRPSVATRGRSTNSTSTRPSDPVESLAGYVNADIENSSDRCHNSCTPKHSAAFTTFPVPAAPSALWAFKAAHTL